MKKKNESKMNFFTNQNVGGFGLNLHIFGIVDENLRDFLVRNLDSFLALGRKDQNCKLEEKCFKHDLVKQ